jgi:hypothetical protein
LSEKDSMVTRKSKTLFPILVVQNSFSFSRLLANIRSILLEEKYSLKEKKLG